MYKGLFLMLLVLGIGSQTIANAPSSNYDNPKYTGDIVGQINACLVLGSSEGVRVYIPGTSFEAITGSVGNFKISYVQSGTYNLTVTQDGHNIGSIPNVTVVSKQTSDIGTVTLCLDNDGDGYGQDVDCNDNNSSINPAAEEVCDDGIDNNCNGQVDEGCTICTDADGDGYFVEGGCGTALDCNDNNASINPGEIEITGNEIDENCDNIRDDIDGDGYLSEAGDCDDFNPAINIGADEICTDGWDNDCDGKVDQEDVEDCLFLP